MKKSILIVVLALLLVPAGSVAAQGKGNKGQKQTASAAQKSSKQADKPARKADADKAARKADKANKKSIPVGTSGIQQQLNDNENLSAKVRSRLPAGTDLAAASAGFQNLGQFVAAVNVSHNQGIPFHRLRGHMVDEGLSLGEAIRAERPNLDAGAIAARAQREADLMIRGR